MFTALPVRIRWRFKLHLQPTFTLILGTWSIAVRSIFLSFCSAKSSALYTVWRHKIQYRLKPYNTYFNKYFHGVVHRQNDKRLCSWTLLHSFTTSNITVSLLEVSLLEQSFWHSTFHSCFPHFIKAFALAEACYSAENRRLRGFCRQPIRFFPHGHFAKYFMHYALCDSAEYKFPEIY